jgi:3-deoxy-D-manno-octulosonic-acid transferase
MYMIYNIFLNLAFFVSFPYLLLRALLGKHGVWERTGILPKDKIENLRRGKTIWFHAASVGEVKALSAITPYLQKNHPEYDLVVSAVTKTGKREAERLLKDVKLVFFMPVDLGRFIRRALRNLEPAALILVETELWPNLIRESKRSGCFVGMINGRISERSFRRYRLAKSLFKETISHFDLLCLQSEEHKERMVRLGADRGRIEITGNLKFDRLFTAIEPDDVAQLRKSLRIPDNRRVVIAGSTREGEEQIIIPVFKKLKQRYDDLLFILAPRHLERLNQLEKILSDSQMSFIRRSRLESSQWENGIENKGELKKTSVILLDTMGELSRLYSLAQVAFVGGTLVPVGGHNLLEPAIYGVPVVFGPFVDNFKEEAKILIDSGGGIKVENQEELFLCLSDLLSDDDRSRKLGLKAQEAIRKRTGVAQKTVDSILSLLEKR